MKSSSPERLEGREPIRQLTRRARAIKRAPLVREERRARNLRVFAEAWTRIKSWWPPRRRRGQVRGDRSCMRAGLFVVMFLVGCRETPGKGVLVGNPNPGQLVQAAVADGQDLWVASGAGLYD